MQNSELRMQNENAQEGVKVSAEEIESALATVKHLRLMFERDFSIDLQIETGLWVPEGTLNPVRHYKDLIVQELNKISSILASFQQSS